MEVTKAETNLTKIAALLGTLQGLTWLVLSLVCVILYNTGLDYYGWTSTSYMEVLSRALYEWFLDKDYQSGYSTVSIVLTPHVFTIFMWIYAVFNLAWFICSLLLYIGIVKNNRVQNVLNAWASISALILTLDVILAVLLGVDYDACLESAFGNVAVQQACTDLIVPVMTIAAKGYVLWIVDVIFVIITFKIARQMKLRLAQSDNMANRQIPRATLQQNPNFYSAGPYPQYMNNPNVPTSWAGNPKGFYDGRSPPASPYYPNQQQYQGR